MQQDQNFKSGGIPPSSYLVTLHQRPQPLGPPFLSHCFLRILNFDLKNDYTVEKPTLKKIPRHKNSTYSTESRLCFYQQIKAENNLFGFH
jgi:hypothetical protein